MTIRMFVRRSREAVVAESGGGPALWSGLAPSLVIFTLAFAVRLFYLLQIQSIPFFYDLGSDGRSYDQWARRIAAGDWLGQGVFYQAPLYPYFLGLLQSVLGHDLWSIRVAQMVLGSASCVLLYWAGEAFFSRAAGIAAGFFLSLYAPAIFLQGLIQKSVLDFFLIALFLWLLGRTRPGPRRTQWALLGAILALLALTRENVLIWLFVVPLWIWFHFAEEQRRRRLEWILFFLVGFALVLFPVGLRNWQAGGEFTLTTAQMGANFYIGNNPSADGTYMPLKPGHGDPEFERRDATEIAEQALGRSLIPREVSNYWLRRSWDYVSAQPLAWLRLMGKKWLIVWNIRELEDAEDFYLYQKWSWLLRWLGWAGHFGVLAPLAALGVLLTWRQRRRLWLLYALLMTLAFSVALFYVFGRYRASMVPLLALFAGAGIVEGFAALRERGSLRLLSCAVVLLASATAVHWRAAGRPGPSVAGYSNLGIALARQGRVNEAIENYQQALRMEPTFSVAHYNLGNLLARQGRLEEATLYYEAALKIDPDFAEAHNNLGDVLAKRGKLDEAIRHFRLALALDPGRKEFLVNLSNTLVRNGRPEEAAKYRREAPRIMKSGGGDGS